MPNTKIEPFLASESSASDEETQLQFYLQRQLEEDVASDVYTECDIKNQEKEIIKYLKNNLSFSNSDKLKLCYAKEEDIDVFLTPKCLSPYSDSKIQKINSCTSPNTELTKEYYALVPIEGNLLDQELLEQDTLSDAFQSIIKTQIKDTDKKTLHVKPTSLALISSHTSKIIKHSSSCDIINTNILDHTLKNEYRIFEDKDNLDNNTQIQQLKSKINEENVTINVKTVKPKLDDKALDCTFSPDSLTIDEPSSSSDYLSAAFNCSPSLGPSDFFPQINVCENLAKMDNAFTSSDSGLENTGMLESLSSFKDVTLTDVSMTESALPESSTDDQNISIDCNLSSLNETDFLILRQQDATSGACSISGTSTEKIADKNIEMTNNTKSTTHSMMTKEEKQRLNEEIVILESSSVSSETGSWESVFPPKGTAKDICERFLNNERLVVCDKKQHTKVEQLNNDKTPCKPSSCFIDASSLVDDEERSKDSSELDIHKKCDFKAESSAAVSQPLPCSTRNKTDASLSDCSENNENEDSLEQQDSKDPDSIQKDISPTIFEMTPITEDSLSTFENPVSPRETKSATSVIGKEKVDSQQECSSISPSRNIYIVTTPHNSIMSIGNVVPINNIKSDYRNDIQAVNCDSHINHIKQTRYDESSPILSGGSSLVSHTPPFESHNSPLCRRRLDNIPIETSISCSSMESNSSQIPSSLNTHSAWIVDMHQAQEKSKNIKPDVKVCENIKKEEINRLSIERNKSRESVDSDSSEKSSHKFYIDLSSLPDPLPEKNENYIDTNEKKNIFSMYIDLGDKAPVRDMPSRLSSSLQSKKSNDNKHSKLTQSNKFSMDSSLPIMFDSPTFEKYEKLCNNPHISIADIITTPKHLKTERTKGGPEKEIIKDKKNYRSVNGESKLKNNSIPIIHEEVHNTSGDLFVKLSDLDKPVQLSDISNQKPKHNIDVRMTRSIPDGSRWGEQNHSATSRLSDVLSSFHSENALSLNRLFPHLKNEFSKSMPGSLSARTRSPLRSGILNSPGDAEEQISEVSELSSVQSSMCRSVMESTTEDTSQTSSFIGNCQSRLGQDLLRMFLEEIAPDVTVEVSGKRIKAHKCILSSRCQYFAGILSGGWVESAGNVIVLPPFSYNVVHFALCHIYSGLSTIPDTISIVELATIADMLGLEGLKEAIMFTLKAKYCHHFHRPCQLCTAGVMECITLSSVYGLDDLYRKCLKWITKYFLKVWPTKAFATLPKELLDKCYQEHILNMSVDNIIDTVCGCGVTATSLHNSRWAETVARMCRRLVNAAAHFAAPRLVTILELTASVSNNAVQPAKQALGDCVTAAIEWAPPDETCRAYAYLSKLVKEIRNQQHNSKLDNVMMNEGSKVLELDNFLYANASGWRLQCEGTLVRAAPRVVGTQAFKDLPSDLRKRLRELGCIMYGPQAIPVLSSPLQDRKCKSVYHGKPVKSNYSPASRSLDMDHVRKSFVPYKPKPITITGLRDDLKNNKLVPPKVRTTKAQEERAKFNTKKNLGQDHSNAKSSLRNPFENTKPRYLEPRPCKDIEIRISPKKLVNKIISSSESSRNSSPIQARNLRSNCVKPKETVVQAMSQDSLATSSRPRTAEPSTDSLSESQATVKSSKGLAGMRASSSARTKIPVLMNHSTGSNGSARGAEVNKRRTQSATVVYQNQTVAVPNKTIVRNSLMSATKSSSAKMVPKINKDGNKASNRPHKMNTYKSIKQQSESQGAGDIPTLGRSGTFLKDEPTFGDKTTNMDIGE
ncbi:unnamed protein product [Leptidea sinapis]|uniref:BTB domain-containing protein n=1 Tax=Leptidea sinapis TaxID=189913 RepID=A0A5E4PKG4_9NEOP|nr:unnamed protein product [Leptidea sinapis]